MNKKNSIFIKPLSLLFIYILVILIFASIYSCLGEKGDFITDETLSFFEGIYFSTVTITTLGYGDITPKTEMFMLITAFESFIGIVIIGVFLNSLWKTYNEKIEEKRYENKKEKNIKNILYYYNFMKSVLDNYEEIAIEITTDFPNRASNKIHKKFNFHAKFSNLSDIFRSTTNMRYGFNTPALSIFYGIEEELTNELKYFLANFDLEDHEKLRSNIVSFLIISHKYKTKYQLLSYFNTTIGDEKMTQYLSRNISNHEQCPEIEGNKVLSPIIYFSKSLITKMECIYSLKSEFKKLA